jgi:hypothetical protein
MYNNKVKLKEEAKESGAIYCYYNNNIEFKNDENTIFQLRGREKKGEEGYGDYKIQCFKKIKREEKREGGNKYKTN